jgi:NAD(P) transhydrogenase subunit alpha
MLMSALFIVIGVFAPTEDEAGESVFLSAFLVFVLSICIGYMVIWNVTPALHTPLMSVTNAISGIIVIGGMLELLPVDPTTMFDEPSVLGVLGVFFASINVIGGFVVTQRMLNMFHKG